MTLQTIDPDAVHYVDLVREIVAWFEVVQPNYDLYDGYVHDDVWPTDWLKRAKAALTSED
jgi:hypothetical protein